MKRVVRARGWALAVAVVAWFAACGGGSGIADDGAAGAGSTAEARPPASASIEAVTLVAELDAASLTPASTSDVETVAIGVFLALRGSTTGEDAALVAEGAALIRELVENTSLILGQCGLTLRVEVAQLVRLPNRLVRFQANAPSSFGGHPPAGTPDPALFNYLQDERLTDDARELFSYGKGFTSPNSISVFTVGSVVYYAAQQERPAAGVAFPPTMFHAADDYPLRNSVVLVPVYASDQLLPTAVAPEALAHELGHMLLDDGDHVPNPQNLMGEGPGAALNEQQCDQVRANRERLFGEDPVPDPGPP